MKLVLIGGTGRSGTSLVYRLLLLSGKMCGYPEFESRLFTANNSLLDVYDVYFNSYSPERLDWVCEAFKSSALNSFKDIPLGKRPFFLFGKNREVVGGAKFLEDYILGLKKDRLTGGDIFKCFRHRSEVLLTELFCLDRSKCNALVEKTPHNILHFKRINAVFPEARMLHIVRDPRAVAESVVRQSWGANSYREAVVWVKLILDTWIRQFENREFDIRNCMCLRVEDLVTKPEEGEMMMREFLDEELVELSLFANPDALDGWRENISTEDFEFANRELKKIMEYFSYSADIIGSAEQSSRTKLCINDRSSELV
jgi:hypothetical protein